MNPGWYADPHGGPDLRWWDGSTWTEHTSPPVGAAPSAPTGDQWAAPVGPPAPVHEQWGAPTQAPPGGHGGPPGPGGMGPGGMGSGGGFPPPQQAGSSNRTLLVVLGIGVALLLVVGGVVLFSGGDDEAGSDPTTTTEADDTTTTAPDDTTTTTDPGSSELVTSGAVSFTRLPAPWEDWVTTGHDELYELTNTAGQFVVVQENAPSGGQWIGNLLIGDLGPSITYTGAADLPAAAQALTDELVASYYVEGAVATPILNTAVEIDGHPAHFIHTELSFAQAGLETTNEKVVVVLVDTGANRPSAFYASIPYNRSDLNAGMDEVYRSLLVDD